MQRSQPRREMSIYPHRLMQKLSKQATCRYAKPMHFATYQNADPLSRSANFILQLLQSHVEQACIQQSALVLHITINM